MNNFLPLLQISLRSVIIYVFIVSAIRLFGKKELSQLSVIDLVFILLISNSVQNAMVGPDTSVLGGMAAALGLFICNYLFRMLLYKSGKFTKLVQGQSIMLVHKGEVVPMGLKTAHMTMDELEMAVREHGVDNIQEADLVVLEVDGNISVLSNNYNQKTVRRRRKPQIQHNP